MKPLDLQQGSATSKPTYLDFFAGAGLASEGLRGKFQLAWANDICDKKAAVFRANHDGVFLEGPIEDVAGGELPTAVLSWASFPCQDLSLAGNLKGITSSRSGLVWQWLRVMDEMAKRPPVVTAENVVGLVSARKGEHYKALHESLVQRGYRVGAVVIDAAHWVPQSRKRVFVVGVLRDIDTSDLETTEPSWCHPSTVVRAAHGLRDRVWWSLPEPFPAKHDLQALIERGAPLDSKEKSSRNIRLVPDGHRERLETAVSNGAFAIPGYKRIRNQRQVLELRFDGLAGCLRTPEGGSSRQLLVCKSNGELRTRLLTVKEAAALMGVRSDYSIPGSYNDGYKAMGDGVAVPVVEFLATNILAKLAERSR